MASVEFRNIANSASAWTSDDILRLLTTTGVGLAVMIVAWRQAEGERLLQDQIVWANVSVGGVLLASYGLVSWILHGRRTIGERRRRLLGEPVGCRAHAEQETAAAAEVLVAAPGRRYFHRSGCPLTADRATEAAALEAHLDASRSPCGVCRP